MKKEDQSTVYHRLILRDFLNERNWWKEFYFPSFLAELFALRPWPRFGSSGQRKEEEGKWGERGGGGECLRKHLMGEKKRRRKKKQVLSGRNLSGGKWKDKLKCKYFFVKKKGKKDSLSDTSKKLLYPDMIRKHSIIKRNLYDHRTVTERQ